MSVEKADSTAQSNIDNFLFYYRFYKIKKVQDAKYIFA